MMMTKPGCRIDEGTLYFGRKTFPLMEIQSVEVGYYGNGLWYWPINGLLIAILLSTSAYSMGGRWNGNVTGGIFALSVITISAILFLRRLLLLQVETVKMTVILKSGERVVRSFESYKEANELRAEVENTVRVRSA
jgi:hypothetical protein